MTKELIQKYADIKYPKCGDYDTRRYGNDRMNEYIVKSTFDVVELSDGTLVAFDKPSIETRFCFSYDEYQDCHGGTDTYKQANDMASNVGYEYFLQENLNQLKTENDLWKFCIYHEDGDGVSYLSCKRDWDLRENERPLTEQERKDILAVLEAQKENLTRRCQTWWKKYGKEHLRTWTYSCWD